jgi:hypothetical protein
MLEMVPFTAHVEQAALDDLARRLAATRWTDELPASERADLPAFGPVAPGWQYGVPREYVQRLVRRWREEFDWREAESRLNAYPQFLTTIDGQRIHVLHAVSPEADATPLVITHGWPSSVFEYLDLIGPLTDPVAHGGSPRDAFHVVIPSVPGFGFSGPTRERGWNRYRIARAWASLMAGLGYQRYGAHGNDVGSHVSPEVGRVDPDHVIGVHVTQLFSFPSGDPSELTGLTDQERGQLEFLRAFDAEMSAYATLQSTAPQTLAHALADSPAGQLAWVAQLLASLDDDFVLTNASLYWLTNTASSAARLYCEDRHAPAPAAPTVAPTGLASFAWDFKPLRRLAERDHANIVAWHDHDRGGHWSTQDAPDLLVDDLRAFFRSTPPRG